MELNWCSQEKGTTMKKLLLLAVMLCVANIAYASDAPANPLGKLMWKAQVSYGILMNPTLNDQPGTVKGGIGIIAQAFIPSKDNIEYGAEAGYEPIYSYDYDAVFGKAKATVRNIPLQGVVRYYISDKKANHAIFLKGAAGLNFLGSTVETFGVSSTESNMRFGIGFGVGMIIKTSTRIEIEPNVRYNIIFNAGDNISMLNIGVGIGF